MDGGGSAARRAVRSRVVAATGSAYTAVVDGYDDGKVACTDRELVIRSYYFLGSGAKHIPYSAIREARRVRLGTMGRWRINGSGDLVHWFNFDARRPRKNSAIVIHLDGVIRPVITPDDPDRVAAVLAEHGVNVTVGSESGLR
jgi:hypothetical protein